MSAIEKAAAAIAKKQRDCFEEFLTPEEIAAEFKRVVGEEMPAKRGWDLDPPLARGRVNGYNEFRSELLGE